MNNKKQILAAIIAVLISVGLVATAVYATTTVGNNVDVGGTFDSTGAATFDSTLTVAGVSTLNGNITLGSAADDTITITGTPTFGATTTFSDVILLSNGEKIDNATDGILNVTGKLKTSASRIADDTGYEYFHEITGDITNTASGAKTYGLYISMERPATATTSGGDIDDAGAKIRVKTLATTATAGNTLRGIDIEAKADNPGGTITNLHGALITAKSDTSAGTVENMWGLSVNVQNNAAVTTTLIAADIRLMRQAATEPGTEYIIRVRNANTSGTGVDAGLAFISDYSGETDDFDYVIDMNSADVDDADIRLSNGETIANTTDAQVKITTATLIQALDATNYWSATQAAGAGVTFDSVSSSTAGFTFSDPITVSGNSTENTKQINMDIEVTDLTHGARQGALAIEVNRAADKVLTSWDGNPDCGLKIQAKNRAANGTDGGTRGIDVNARNRDSGTQSWINAIYATAEHDGSSLASMSGIEVNTKSTATLTGDAIGIRIHDQSTVAPTGNHYGLKLTAQYNLTREFALFVDSDLGTWTNGLSFNGNVTNVLDFESSDGTNGAKTSVGANQYAITAPTTADGLIKVDIAGTSYWIPVFDADSVTNE